MKILCCVYKKRIYFFAFQTFHHLCSQHDITINKLAALSALPPSSIKNILYGKSRDPKILTIQKLCDGLGITLGQFFNSPEFEALEQEIK